MFTSVLLVGVVSSPSLATDDRFVPAQNCAPDKAEAVGHPAASTALAETEQVDPPASANNLGESTGAQAGDVQPPC